MTQMIKISQDITDRKTMEKIIAGTAVPADDTRLKILDQKGISYEFVPETEENASEKEEAESKEEENASEKEEAESKEEEAEAVKEAPKKTATQATKRAPRRATSKKNEEKAESGDK